MSRVQTSIRIDEKTFVQSKQILKSLGLNFTSAVNIFANMVVQKQGLPFAVKIPNKATLKAIQEVEKGIGETVSFDEFIKNP